MTALDDIDGRLEEVEFQDILLEEYFDSIELQKAVDKEINNAKRTNSG
tara:strand:+ start:1420 stop:1563 length:144 start_codon:yes stop_codon:yes gene_type:complete